MNFKVKNYVFLNTGTYNGEKQRRHAQILHYTCSIWTKIFLSSLRKLTFYISNKLSHIKFWPWNEFNIALFQSKHECAPSEDSDQPGHPPSLIRVFAVHSMGSFLHADSEDSDQTGRMLGAHSSCWFCHVAALFLSGYQSAFTVMGPAKNGTARYVGVTIILNVGGHYNVSSGKFTCVLLHAECLQGKICACCVV